MRKTPNLVNPQNWTPFKNLPIKTTITSKPINIPLTQKELIQRNSFYLNFFGAFILIGLCYSLYLIYLEKRMNDSNN